MVRQKIRYFVVLGNCSCTAIPSACSRKLELLNAGSDTFASQHD